MCKFKTLGVSWPPKGWKELELVDQSYGQAISKNPKSAVVTGMSYMIEPIPVIDPHNKRSYLYALRIEGWDYNIYNESFEYPILSFVFKERDVSADIIVSSVSDLKTSAQKLPMTERSAHRIFMAALFMMKQIEKGSVPDFERVLRLYKIHPAQRNLYVERDYMPPHSQFCGLQVERLSNNVVDC